MRVETERAAAGVAIIAVGVQLNRTSSFKSGRMAAAGSVDPCRPDSGVAGANAWKRSSPASSAVSLCPYVCLTSR